jgi:hypothetical protein
MPPGVMAPLPEMAPPVAAAAATPVLPLAPLSPLEPVAPAKASEPLPLPVRTESPPPPATPAAEEIQWQSAPATGRP